MKIGWKKRTTQSITFRSSSDHVWNVREKPSPASKHTPTWWKTLSQHMEGYNSIDLAPAPTVTVKRCLPVLDSLTAGYIVTLWSDVQVTSSKETGINIRWSPEEPVFDLWSPLQVSKFELPEECTPHVFKYLHGWVITTPPGWSCLITHPIAYPNLPFKVITGIVDTDKLTTIINTPIVFKKGFEGILEKGTPMFQIIPIKRSNWESKVVKGDPDLFKFSVETLKTRIVSSYGRYLRVPKVYK